MRKKIIYIKSKNKKQDPTKFCSSHSTMLGTLILLETHVGTLKDLL
jgi:hypothetical protein